MDFENRRVSKRYLAIVRGVVPDDSGRIELPMDRAKGLGILKRFAPQTIIDRLIANLLSGSPTDQASPAAELEFCRESTRHCTRLRKLTF